ncbi:hypothetical protein Bca52824_023823 [Brassica carinata]|uniref:Uncharacterized protein n=1 Tax=Brassica carinata TaxID=52824 RepID=A0A8X7VJ81_BRACI|nr:hypothetical protein Bca52824_023823 [Brassica carinata]
MSSPPQRPLYLAPASRCLETCFLSDLSQLTGAPFINLELQWPSLALTSACPCCLCRKKLCSSNNGELSKPSWWPSESESVSGSRPLYACVVILDPPPCPVVVVGVKVAVD